MFCDLCYPKVGVGLPVTFGLAIASLGFEAENADLFAFDGFFDDVCFDSCALYEWLAYPDSILVFYQKNLIKSNCLTRGVELLDTDEVAELYLLLFTACFDDCVDIHTGIIPSDPR